MQINNTPIARSVVAPRVTSNRQEMNFGAAKDINLRYIMEKRSHLLPPRMWSAVSEDGKTEIKSGEIVEIVKVDGNKLLVRKKENEKE